MDGRSDGVIYDLVVGLYALLETNRLDCWRQDVMDGRSDGVVL